MERIGEAAPAWQQDREACGAGIEPVGSVETRSDVPGAHRVSAPKGSKSLARLCTLPAILLAAGVGYAQSAPPASAPIGVRAADTSRVSYQFLIDRRLSMRSGVENIIAAHVAVSRLEDRLIGTRWFPESRAPAKVGGLSIRLAKYALLDLPVDYFSIVLGHEYFGHGARYRELGLDDIHYGFDLPPPYGPGGGEASHYGNTLVGLHQLLAIWQGGLEMHGIANRKLTLAWLHHDRIPYRQASQYIWSIQIMIKYVQDAEEDLADGGDDDDPRAYVRLLNAGSGYSDPQNLRMDVSELKKRMTVNIVSPMLAQALFTLLKTYLWDGRSSGPFWSVPIGALNYVPNLRTELTPFGIQYHFENYIKYRSAVSLFDLRVGSESFFTSWGGLGIVVENGVTVGTVAFDVNLDVWRQPELTADQNFVALSGRGAGVAGSARAHIPFSKAEFPLIAVVELGAKTRGFLEGYPLEASPVLLVGLALGR